MTEHESRFARAVRAVVTALVEPFQYHGLRRYRVVRNVGGRIELQAVRKAGGFPDTLPISVQPGGFGLSGTPALGAVVLVAFIEGDPSLPIVTHGARTDDAAFVPLSSALDASGTVRIGEHADLVELGSGSETLSALAAHGRVVRYGDPIAGLTSGASVELPGAGPVSKVSA